MQGDQEKERRKNSFRLKKSVRASAKFASRHLEGVSRQERNYGTL